MDCCYWWEVHWKQCSRLKATSYAWFTFSSQVLVKSFGEMWIRQSTHECRHSHSRARIVDNEARHSRHSRFLYSGLIYRHVSESFGTKREQVESVEDEMNVPFTLLFSSCLMLSRWECKPGISDIWAIKIKLSVIVDTYTYLCYTDKKSPIF